MPLYTEASKLTVTQNTEVQNFKSAYQQGKITYSQLQQALSRYGLTPQQIGVEAPYKPPSIQREDVSAYGASASLSNMQLSPETKERTEAYIQAQKQAPEGYVVAGVEKTDEGYVATYRPESTPPKSLGEQIAGFDPFLTGVGIAEQLLGKKATPTQKQKLEAISRQLPSGIAGIRGKPTEILGGAVASFEAPVYGVAGLLGARNLPRPPTASGAIVSSAFESIKAGKPVKSSEWRESEALSEAWNAGTAIGDVLFGYAAGYTIGKIWRGIRGTPVSKVGAVSETQLTAEIGDMAVGQRTTRIATTTEHVKGSYAKYIKEMQRYFTPKHVELGGTETAMGLSDDLAVITKRGYTAVRPAEPYFETAKAAANRGILSKAVSPYKQVTQRIMGLLAEPSERRVLTYAQRSFSATQFLGEIDSQVYLKFAKNVPPDIAQSMYMQMGGLPTAALEKGAVKTVQVVSKVVDVGAETGVSATAAASATLGSAAARQLTRPATPKTGTVAQPKIRTVTPEPPIITPQPKPASENRITNIRLPKLMDISYIEQLENNVNAAISSVNEKANRDVANITDTFIEGRETEDTINDVLPSIREDVFSDIIQEQTTRQTPSLKEIVRQSEKARPAPIFPVYPSLPYQRFPWLQPPKRRLPQRRKTQSRAAWYQRVHPVRTPEQMLNVLFGSRGQRRTRRRR
ncbi:MAG: hypothetical protein ACPLIG_00040 [Candidatus Bathyarchaeales archaeon]